MPRKKAPVVSPTEQATEQTPPETASEATAVDVDEDPIQEVVRQTVTQKIAKKPRTPAQIAALKKAQQKRALNLNRGKALLTKAELDQQKRAEQDLRRNLAQETISRYEQERQRVEQEKQRVKAEKALLREQKRKERRVSSGADAAHDAYSFDTEPDDPYGIWSRGFVRVR